MGDGVKLPEAERPPMASISKRLDDRVSRKLQSLFVADIQNDCTCSIERYDSDMSGNVLYLSVEGIKEKTIGNGLPLPMKEDISDQEIWSLLEAAIKHAGNILGNFGIWAMLYNSKCDSEKLQKAMLEWSRYIHPERILSADFVPIDCVFFFPDPEFFGAISVNIDKFGAFCIADHIVKKFLE